MRIRSSVGAPRKRAGIILVLFALLLPLLLGIMGLVIDAGNLLAAYRQAQNAADAGAQAAALDLVQGRDASTALATATTFVQQHNGLSSAAVALNNPPSQGPYAGDSRYVEVLVTYSVNTWFIQALSGSAQQIIRTRAVAGYESVSGRETILTLDPGAVPGLTIGNATLQVQGRVAVNSEGAGVDQTGAAVSLGLPPFAVTTGNNAVLEATEIRVVGGVDVLGDFQPLPSGSGNPLKAGLLPRADPLRYLPTPTTATGVANTFPGINGQTFSTPQNVSATLTGTQNATLAPGIYSSIEILGTGTGTVTFSPGIYVLQGGSSAGHALQISTGATIVATGVMFYNTGSNYSATTGSPDSADGDTLGTDSTSATTFGDVSIQAGLLNLTPLNDTSSAFDGMWLYQRRWNTKRVTLQGGNGKDQVTGTSYCRWAGTTLAGPGTFQGQFIAGSMIVTGSGQSNVMTLTYGGKLGKAGQVFLVE